MSPTEAIVMVATVSFVFFIFIGYFFLGFFLKLVWGFWPTILSLVVAVYTLWEGGLAWAWLASFMVLGMLLGPWLWQRTALYLNVDEAIDRIFMLGD